MPQRPTAADPRRYDDYLERILTSRVYDVAIETPLERAPRLSARLGNDILLKREDLQPVFSFKIRGAYNKIAGLDPAVRARGVIAASAGNHAQGVALAARRFGCRAIIVMPAGTPRIKHEAVAALGGEVVLHGETFQEAAGHARALADADGIAFIHPYDDPAVIAGQGTIAVEILRQLREPPHTVLVAIGGGGLIGGIAACYAGRIRIIGVEPEVAPTLTRALEAGKPVDAEAGGIAADSLAPRRVGELVFPLAKKFVSEVVLVSDDEIRKAQDALWRVLRIVSEPGGAAAFAALFSGRYRPEPEERVGVLVSGGNTVAVDFYR